MDISIQALALFSEWISFLFLAVPPKIAPTLLELLIGCIVSRDGHVSSTILAIRPGLTWTAYYKALERHSFSWSLLARQWLRLLLKLFPAWAFEFAIDDFLVPRASKKAPSAGLHHDHATRPNRPRYIWGQLRVCLAVICRHKGRIGCFPLLLRLMDKTGNATKMDAARVLMNIILKWLPEAFPVILLVDAWYMKGPLVLSMLSKGVTVIGQARKDSAIYLPLAEIPKNRRGRRPGKGPCLTLSSIQAAGLPKNRIIRAYGGKRLFQIHSCQAQVRFLSGRLCRIVWCRFLDKDSWSKWHLLISTNPDMTGVEVVKRYSRRWSTEPMFNELKHLFGLANAWQQSRQALARWSQVICLALSLPRLLALWMDKKSAYEAFPIPWRKKRQTTAGWMAEGLSWYFRNVSLRAMWDRKLRKFTPHFPDSAGNSRRAA